VMTRNLLRAAMIVFAACILSGCEWLVRRETVSYQAGDAVAWNKAIHTIDPWPASSADTTIPVSGRRVARAIERYENGDPAGAAPLAPPPGAAIMPSPAP
jgi:hypothetical protein